MTAKRHNPPKGFSMDPVTGVYAAFMAVGVLWIIWRLVIYLRIQKRREFLWDKFIYDDHFMNFLDGIKSQEVRKVPVTMNGESAPNSQSGPGLSASDGESQKG